MIFYLASFFQYTYHAILYTDRMTAQAKRETSTGRPTYALPNSYDFQFTCTPHYLWEVVIYLCLSRFAAPHGCLLNWTIFCATIFACTNLGITADGTKKWYAQLYGEAAVKHKARMIPGIW
jgi:3-oxo-5-alpha-steroid 4-dehydrogenase 3 / polyprenol reductase